MIEFFKNAKKRRVEKVRHQLYIFLICLIISLFLWFLVRLSKEYPSTIRYSLQYVDVPSGFSLTGFSDSTLYLNVRMQGYEYFSERYFNKKVRSLDVNLHRIRVRASDDNVRGFLLTKNLIRAIAEQTGYNSENMTVTPDTLFFMFERKDSFRKFSPARSLEISGRPDSLRALKDSGATKKPVSRFNDKSRNK